MSWSFLTLFLFNYLVIMEQVARTENQYKDWSCCYGNSDHLIFRMNVENLEMWADKALEGCKHNFLGHSVRVSENQNP